METKKTGGFTLVELVIVMAVIALILSVVIPNLRGMQQEAQNTKVEAELDTLKTAVVAYWRNTMTYPPDMPTLLGSAPSIVTAKMNDPYQTVNGTYGYLASTDPNFGDYFIIYSKGPNGDTTSSAISFVNGAVHWTGSGRVVSNAPTYNP